MNLQFKRLVIEGFLSMGYAELDLEDRGFVLLNGINNNPDDGTRSNGAGKSVCMEALVWCLTGETIRGISKNIANIHTDTGARVECEFSVDGKDYRLCRYKDHCEFGTNLKIYINEEDKSGKGIRDSEKLLAEYLPDLTSSLLGSVVVLGQGLPARLTNNTPAGRKEVLEKLSKSDFMIEDIKERLAARKELLSGELREAEDKILAGNSSVKSYQHQEENYAQQLNQLADPQSLIDAINQAEARGASLQNTIGELETKRATLRTNREDLANQKVTVVEAMNRAVRSVEDRFLESRSVLQTEVAQLRGQCRVLSEEITRLENIKDICPTCGQKLPNVHKVDTSDKQAELKELDQKLDAAQSKLAALQVQERDEVEQVKKPYQEQSLELVNNIAAVDNDLQLVSKQLTLTQQEFNAQGLIAAKAKACYDSYEISKSNLEKSLKDTREKITKLQQEVLYNTESRNHIKAQCDTVAKMSTLATRDFRGVLLINVIAYLNSRIKIYSADIFGTDKAEMSLDGNALNISYDHKLYENLSGGERRKVDLIVSFAIRDMLCQYSGFSANILCLDEITDGVDDLGVRNIFNCIAKRLSNLESIFIITHKSDLENVPVDSVLTVIKGPDGVSFVRRG